MTDVVERLKARGMRELECGNGWLDILDRLDQQIAAIDPDYKVLQVKEKFAGLRFYISSEEFEKVSPYIRLAEIESFKTCEETGKPGVLMRKKNGHWIRTLDPETFSDDYEISNVESPDNPIL